MAALTKLFGDAVEEQKRTAAKSPKKKKELPPRGCEYCPLRKKKVKVFGVIRGRAILILGMGPGGQEVVHDPPMPFVGRAGKLLWSRAAKYGGFERKDCDVDNVTRCRATSLTEYGNIVDRAPTEKELWCCSLHTETQLKKASPKVILLLGKVAQKQFLGKKYRADRQVYWDEERECKVICAHHPAYLLRGAGKEASDAFNSALVEVKRTLQYPGKYGYVESLDMKRLENVYEVRAIFKEFRESGRTLVCDIEDGRDKEGHPIILCVGFSDRKGWGRVVFFDHPEVVKERGKFHSGISQQLKLVVGQFLADPRIEKSFWHGVYDVLKLKDSWGVDVRGYELDGELTEYLAYPDRKDYTLAKAAEVRFKEFAGYKTIVDEYLDPEDVNFATVPVKVLTLRCGLDCDLTRRAIVSAKKKVNLTLAKMLTAASFTFQVMEERGILYDVEYAPVLQKVYVPLEEKLTREIAFYAGKPDFKPTDQNIGWLLTEKLGIDIEERTPTGRIAVSKTVLEKYQMEHPVIALVQKKRYVGKINSTYGESFEECAKVHGGRLRTRFKITGTVTGRPSSGGDKKSKNIKDRTRVNFQNIHGDPNVQNLLVSTLKWRDIVRAYRAKQSES